MEKESILLQELIQVGKLEVYAAELHDILKRIRQDGCEISTIYNDERSRLETTKTPPYRSRIRLSLVEGRLHCLHLIWDLLHEFGHHQSGPKQDSDNTLEREELAWELAERELLNYSRLVEEAKNFNNYRIKCIKSYEK